jgi:hypothetical protein
MCVQVNNLPFLLIRRLKINRKSHGSYAFFLRKVLLQTIISNNNISHSLPGATKFEIKTYQTIFLTTDYPT